MQQKLYFCSVAHEGSDGYVRTKAIRVIALDESDAIAKAKAQAAKTGWHGAGVFNVVFEGALA